ncbi:DUF4465 domain-containing protein [Methylomonas rivi]|uniref:DUF4465 domain-containing protein n=1 Tax=Methylomonas rivi TaxID=2952226 RepID=A0ABT1U885_9GAMM|nr:DUF4465 domain-containing protein [Methylomonas sp. WSC-6]MCQ8130064.1 DUF4465 domain-containing protein [Methylomonas sp. WSC-6]
MNSKLSALTLLGLTLVNPVRAAVVSDFENLALAPNSYWAGTTDPSVPLYTPNPGGFNSGLATFSNQMTDWDGFTSWSGWAYSNMTDSVTPGYENQYSVYTGQAQGGNNFGLAYVTGDSARIDFSGTVRADGFYLTNTTYAVLSMLSGDSFAKKFGGTSGNDADWLKLTVTGLNGGAASSSIDFYLADYRFGDNSLDYIVDTWEWLDLSPLGEIDAMQFAMSSSDSGLFGMNTPGYFAMDNLTVTAVPLPAAVWFMASGLLALRGFGRGRARKNAVID